MNITEGLIALGEKLQRLFDAGKQTERNTFWENFQGGGGRTYYRQCFITSTNLEKFFFPKYDIKPTNSAEMFRAAKSNNFDLAQRLRDCGVVLDTSKVNDLTMMFYYANIMTIPTISFEGITNSYYLGSTFGNCYAKTIEKIILPKTVGFSNSCFQGCTNLENITFEGALVGNGLILQWSTKLTHDSLMSLINCLADKSTDTSGTVWEVIIGETNLAKLTTDELKIAHNKGWIIS